MSTTLKVFPVVMYRCESWTIKKIECRRIDAFVLWCWRRLLRVSWIARSNQSILKEINPEYSIEGLMLKLKLQYFGHLRRRADSLEKILCLHFLSNSYLYSLLSFPVDYPSLFTLWRIFLYAIILPFGW